jgi:hypothetical protein
VFGLAPHVKLEKLEVGRLPNIDSYSAPVALVSTPNAYPVSLDVLLRAGPVKDHMFWFFTYFAKLLEVSGSISRSFLVFVLLFLFRFFMVSGL